MTRIEYRHNGQVLSATITLAGEVVVFDRPAADAGKPDTVTAAESADWAEDDWRRLAQRRITQMRRRQRKAGLSGPHSRLTNSYFRETLRQQEAMRPRWTLERIDSDAIDICYGGLIVESWRYEQVSGIGMVWARYPPGHAYPTDFQRAAPTL